MRRKATDPSAKSATPATSDSSDPSERHAADSPKPLPPRAERKRGEAPVDEALVDEAVAETLPASDPISPYSRETSKPVRLNDEDEPESDKVTASEAQPPAKWQGWKRGE